MNTKGKKAYELNKSLNESSNGSKLDVRAEYLLKRPIQFPPAPTGAYAVDEFLIAIETSRRTAGSASGAEHGVGSRHASAESAEVGCSAIQDTVVHKLDTAFICGRYHVASGQAQISSGGKSIFIRAPIEAMAVLISGDIVAFEVTGAKADQDVFLAHDFILLVATRADEFRCPGVFDVNQSKNWAIFLGKVRGFFSSQGFTEMQTPTLVPSPGTEPFLEPFVTDWKFGQIKKSFYLPTSPEFHLKKLLCTGWTRIFEIKTCFRNGEISEYHQPEFQMLEWYRAYSDLHGIASDVEGLIRVVVETFSPATSFEASRLQRLTMRDLFKDKLNFDLKPTTNREELALLASAVGTRHLPDDSFDDIFFRIFLEHLEPGLGMQRPLLLSGYPPSQAALARLNEEGFADRFEIYWRGLEIANAFHELNDPEANLQRFLTDAEIKERNMKTRVPVDADLMQALNYGLPPSAGIAIGLERLFMAVLGLKSINETRAFPMIT